LNSIAWDDGEEAAPDTPLSQDPEKSPGADPRPVFERGLYIRDALAGDRWQRRVDEYALGVLVAVENVVLAAGFIVERDLHRDARTVRPLRLRRVPAVTHEVARVVARHVEADWGLLWHGFPLLPVRRRAHATRTRALRSSCS
jgi:hypothetical protein